MNDLIAPALFQLAMRGIPAGEVGRYLAWLTPVQEDRVLTQRMGYAPNYVREDGCRCLRGTAEDFQPHFIVLDVGQINRMTSPTDPVKCGPNWSGRVYDLLCMRFGEDRINQAVRNRILRNRVRRTLTAPIQETVAV